MTLGHRERHLIRQNYCGVGDFRYVLCRYSIKKVLNYLIFVIHWLLERSFGHFEQPSDYLAKQIDVKLEFTDESC